MVRIEHFNTLRVLKKSSSPVIEPFFKYFLKEER
nr:MAG TPA: hypothetical protein [Caudoviricetes sp.]